MKIKITEVNTKTGEEIFYEIDETPEEEKLRLESIAKAEAEITEFKAKAQAKAELLKRLGITEKEAALLLDQ